LASLILHGTPPFVVYYRTQQDKEPARELSKTFPGSRGELSLQPERSGHYSYSFIQISDANYKKVELQGPSIDQVVHPLAAAEFASGQAGSMRNKRVLSSCSGDTVDVDVDLRVIDL
jgi:nucleoporin POM152